MLLSISPSFQSHYSVELSYIYLIIYHYTAFEIDQLKAHPFKDG